MTLRQNLTSLALGLVLLGGLVAFALLPAATGGEQVAAPVQEAGAADAVDLQACRTMGLVLARTPYEQAMDDVETGLRFEEQGGDGGAGFHDWVDVEALSQTLARLGDGIAAAAATPGLSGEVHEGAVAVVEAATALDQGVTGGILVVEDLRAAHLELGVSILELEAVCA